MKASELPSEMLGPLPRDENGPLFAEPWQAGVFAMTVKLAEAGHFTWDEWSRTLGAELEAARTERPNDPGSYYERWLSALEKLLAVKGFAEPCRLAGLKTAWTRAYERTPHGTPVRLSPGDADEGI